MKFKLNVFDWERIERKLSALGWRHKMFSFLDHMWTKDDVFFNFAYKDELQKLYNCETGRYKK